MDIICKKTTCDCGCSASWLEFFTDRSCKYERPININGENREFTSLSFTKIINSKKLPILFTLDKIYAKRTLHNPTLYFITVKEDLSIE